MTRRRALHALENGFILDMHVHVAGIGAGSGCYLSRSLADNWRYGLYLQAFRTSRREIEQHGDAVVIKRIWESLRESRYVDGALLLALDKVYDPVSHEPDLGRTEVYIPNEFVRDEIAPFPNLYYGASVHPYRKDWQAELQRVHDDNALLIKWLPAIQHIDPSDPVIVPFYRMLKELGLPLLVHTGAERSFSSSHDALGDPQLLHLPLREGVTVIAAHVATSGQKDGIEYMDRLLPMLDRYKNLYTDISSLTQLNKRKYPPRVLKRRDLFGKLLFGSDFPLTSAGIGPFRLVSPWYFLRCLPLSKIRELSGEKNVWDRDVLLKHALGFPEEAFTRPAKMLLKHRLQLGRR
ncbi:MAG: amidohydrolase family protein [Deltaproteobacteria bacterium]